MNTYERMMVAYLLLASVLAILMVFWVVMNTIGNPFDPLCKNETPNGYELEGQRLLLGEDVEDPYQCWYETTGEHQWDECVKTFRDTDNHGRVKVVDTCKGY